MTSSIVPNTFEYLIVGGGTAGLVLAARLTEDPNTTVGVIEAGEDWTTHPDFVVPGFATKNFGKPDINWDFYSTPQPGANNRKISVPRGKVLGGSSCTNITVFGRGHKEEYNAFETLGSKGWNWDSMLEYFKKSETFSFTPVEADAFGVTFNPDVHGTTGPLQRSLPKWCSDVHTPFLEAVKSLGIPFNPDPNDGDNYGVSNSNHSIDPVKNARTSAASTYYEFSKSRPNLHVITGAEATRILFEPRTQSGSANVLAQGAEYSKGGKLYTVSATKEVLLCSGVIQSPKLLELSGIGDRKVLEKYGIPVLVELQGVGNNLRSLFGEHFRCSYTGELNPGFESLDTLRDGERALREWKLYEETKTGMLSAVGSGSLFAFVPPKPIMSDESLKSATQAKVTEPLYPKILALQQEWLAENIVPHIELGAVPGFMPATTEVPQPGKMYFSLLLALLHPFSRGSVHISSSDPLAEPNLDLHVLDNDIDVQMLVDSLKFARKLVQQDGFKKVFKEESLPGLNVQTDDEMRAYIRNTVQTVFHPVGSASMLPREDNGVVDPELRVYGTANLRVIDASVMPINVSAHTQATVYAIAERGADIIRGKVQI